MATYQFSALADGQAISFNPNTDLLNFDQTVIAAADLRAVAEGSNVRISVATGANAGKDVLLLNTSLLQLAISNITFADGSRLLFGDSTAATTADNGTNSIAGTAGRDHLNGLGGNDTLGGGAGDDFLAGGAGNDSLGGGTSGNDTLEGGLGNDMLAGGSGQDVFVFREAGAANADLLNDFGTNWDRIELDGSALTALGAVGQFAAGDARFYAAAGASSGHDADDRIIFNTSTGQIFYDADGSGAGAAQILANLPSGRTLAAADFRVVGTPVTSGGGSGNDSLTGTSGNDTLDGFGGNDTLDGGAGSDLLRGGDGDDTLRDLDTSEFSDTLDGGLGNDTYDLRSPASDAQDATIVDAGGVDTLLTNRDGFLSLHPEIENLTLFGGDFAGGNDLDNRITTVSDASHRYFANGGGGDDTLIGGAGSEYYQFGPHESGSSYGDDSVDGGEGFDTFLFDEAPFAIVADMRNGTLTSGTSGTVTFTHVERLVGGTQGDRLTAHDGAAWVDANGLEQFTGAWLYGGGGNDTLIGGAADDYISGDGGDEVNNYFSDSGDGDDSISGGGGNDWITFRFSPGVSLSYGNDVVDGGQGIDTVAFGDPLFSGMVIDLGAGTASGGGWDGAGSALLSNVENVVISSGGVMDNRLSGSSVANLLQGGRGNDTIDGGAGNDTLTGGEGRDQFTFVLAPSGGNADRITDFQTGLDKVFLDPGAFSAIGAPGNFAAGDARFASNASGTAQDANDRIVYNTNTGQLWYDADGSGAGAAQLIATLAGAPSVAATDIAAGEGTGSGGIIGTDGNDTLNGTAGDELIDGRGGNDIIDGFGGNDTLDGGFGNDWVSGTGLLLGGDGDDRLEQYFSGLGTLRGGAGNDTLTGYDELHGDGGDDVLLAPDSDGVLIDAGAGNDTMSWEPGDTVDGGAGSDTVFIGEQVDLVIDLRTQTVSNNGGTVLGTFSGIESINRGQQRLFGGDDHTYRFDDYFIGNDASNALQSNLGSDTLNGGLGNDTLTAFNLDGDDVYTFSAAPGAANADLVVGFISGHATLQLDLPAHGALGARGNFVSGDARFFAGAGANSGQDTSDRIVYNTNTGQLWYDADGSGVGAAQLIATLTNASQTGAALLTATDIAVIDSRSAPAGTAGDDWMAGVDGYVNDSFSGGAGNDRFDGREGNDTISGGIGNDTLDGGDGADLVAGGDGNDTLRKAAGRHDGGTDVAVDTVDGGLGDDIYEFNQVMYDIQDVQQMDFSFQVVIADAGGVDTVVSTGSWTLDEGLENLTLRPWDQTSHGVGNSLNNLIISEIDDADRFVGDTLDGAGGNDTLLGGMGNDSINGGAGNDSIVGGIGNDTMSGDAGDDTFLFAVAPSGNNADQIVGFVTGADTIQLDGAVFTNIGTAGDFAAGDARFFAGAGANSGQDASDRVVYNTSNGQLWYDADGNGAGAAQLVATLSGAPTLVAADLAAIGGPAAPMTLNGTAGNDSLVGAGANDTINGLAGNDTLVGNAGDDSLNGGTGTDSMDGGLGNDTYVVTTGDILVDGGGTDTVVTDVTWSLGVEFENLTMTGTGNITMQGNTLNNLIIGNAGNNSFNARAGDDTILAGAGDDRIDMFGNGAPSYGNEVVDGGSGFDTMDFSGYAKTGIVVNLASGTVAGGGDGGSGTVAVSNVERVITGAFNDRLTGNAAANNFDGRGGQDTISGGGGNDTLTGGAGNDFFVFNSPAGSSNVDRITDFVSGFDHLQLENETFTAIGATGNFASGDGRFWAAAGATTGHDASDRLVYNTSTGSLYYDADGSGSGAAILVATFQGNPAIAATDITVI